MGLACNLSAIGAADRPRYDDLVARLRLAIKARTELNDGYEYLLDTQTIALDEVGEWIALESRCCPFFAFRLDVNEGAAVLALRGPEGAKGILVHFGW